MTCPFYMGKCQIHGNQFPPTRPFELVKSNGMGHPTDFCLLVSILDGFMFFDVVKPTNKESLLSPQMAGIEFITARLAMIRQLVNGRSLACLCLMVFTFPARFGIPGRPMIHPRVLEAQTHHTHSKVEEEHGNRPPQFWIAVSKPCQNGQINGINCWCVKLYMASAIFHDDFSQTAWNVLRCFTQKPELLRSHSEKPQATTPWWFAMMRTERAAEKAAPLGPSFGFQPSLAPLLGITCSLETWISGWWLGHPSENYEFVNWDDDVNPIVMGKCRKWQPNHQPDII